MAHVRRVERRLVCRAACGSRVVTWHACVSPLAHVRTARVCVSHPLAITPHRSCTRRINASVAAAQRLALVRMMLLLRSGRRLAPAGDRTTASDGVTCAAVSLRYAVSSPWPRAVPVAVVTP